MMDVKDYLAQKQSANQPLCSDWSVMAELYDKRYY